MMTLFDEERIRRNYAASERREAVRDAVENMLKTGKMSIEEIAGYFTELLICIIFEKFRANGKAENPQFIGIPVKLVQMGSSPHPLADIKTFSFPNPSMRS